MLEVRMVGKNGRTANTACPAIAPVNGGAEASYRVWACDNQVYGPVTASTLLEWIQDGRVFHDTWLFLEHGGQWRQAGDIAALQHHFQPGEGTQILLNRVEAAAGVCLADLRQFNIFAGLSAGQLLKLLQLAEFQEAAPREPIIRRRDPGDSIYLVLSGSVRARLEVGGDERVLARIQAGEFFGELSMFTHSPRSADVVAEEETRLLRFTAEAFQKLITEDPAAAAPLLHGIASDLAHRIVDDNQRFQKEVAAEFVWR